MSKSFIAIALAVSLAGCSEKVHATVTCASVAGPAVECTLTQKAGKTEVEVCWDFEIVCGNGQVVKAPHTCDKVRDGGTTKLTIPGDKLAGVDKCAAPNGEKPTATVKNITLNGKPSE